MPRPVLQAMVLADHVYQDRLSGKFIISGTFGRIALRAAPVAQPPVTQPPTAPQPPAAPPSFTPPPAAQPSFNPPPAAPPRPAAPAPIQAQPAAPAPIQAQPGAPVEPSPATAAPSQTPPPVFQPRPSAPVAPAAPAAPPPAPVNAEPSMPQPGASPAMHPPPAYAPPTPPPAGPPVQANPPPAPAVPAAPRQAQPKNENYVSHSLDTAAAQISVSGSPYLYLALTSIHHKAALNIQFVNQSDGDTIFDALLEVTSSDPVSVSEFCVPMPQLPITKPGVYSIDLLYSGEILGSWRLVASTI